MGATPRLRLFAGPNGSGKSVLKSHLPQALLGVYLNPDEIEAAVRRDGFLDLNGMALEVATDEIRAFFSSSGFLIRAGLSQDARELAVIGGKLDFGNIRVNSYHASVLVDFLRGKLLQDQRTLTFESVMSHPGKVEFLKNAQTAVYRTYLYYVATDDPEINISRVRNLVALGGHPVPEEKIVRRYHASLNLAMDAVRNTNRAYIFDNSTDKVDERHTWLAEITDGRTLELKTDRVPGWFKRAILDRM